MDYPISVPSVGLVGGKFVDEDPLAGTPGSLIPAQWGNAVTEEILKVITDAGLVPDEENNTQLSEAIKAIIVAPNVAPGRLIGIQKITANGTYTPTPGMKHALIDYAGGGGGSGVVVATTAAQTATVGGGTSGSYGRAWLTAAQIGASQVVTIGAGGAGGTAGSAGGNGGATSFGSLLTAPGGGGSPASPGAVSTSAAGISVSGIPGAAATGGNVASLAGQQGMFGLAAFSNTVGGFGGSNPLGSGGFAGGASSIPTSGSGYGAGAGGPSNGASSAAKVGVSGTPGVIIIYEYS